MADVNWTKYGCDVCRMIGLAAAAVGAGLIAWILLSLGVGMVWGIILFLLVWGILGFLVDNFCESRSVPPAVVEPAGMRPAGVPVEAATFGMSEDARAAEEGARAAAAEERAVAAEEARSANVAPEGPDERTNSEEDEQEASRGAEEAAEIRARENAEREAAREANKAEIAATVVNERLEQFDDQFDNREEAREETDTNPPAEDRDTPVDKESRAAAESGDEAALAAAREATGDPEPGGDGTRDRDGDGIEEGKDEGEKPDLLTAARGDGADDLRKIKGIGPKLEAQLNSMGVYHFDQIASWTDQEVAWVDANLDGFNGRVSRDNWVEQAKVLASMEN